MIAACPSAVTDTIVLKTGQLQFTNSKFQSVITHQHFTDRVFLEITGFSVSCGQIHLSWFLLSHPSSCSINSAFNGSLPDNSRYQTVTGLKLQDDKSYKIAIKASDLRHKTFQVVCSSVLVIDTSRPQGGWINDGPGADRSFQASKLLQVNWGGVSENKKWY